VINRSLSGDERLWASAGVRRKPWKKSSSFGCPSGMPTGIGRKRVVGYGRCCNGRHNKRVNRLYCQRKGAGELS